MTTKIHALSVLMMILVLSACGDKGADTAFNENISAKLQPEDDALAEIYNRSCKNCHTISATSAPLTGDSAAWSQRMDKGMDTLVDNVINGSGGMPPFGLCMDCDPEQFEALIHFMAQPPQ